jgi:hypothetical protein
MVPFSVSSPTFIVGGVLNGSISHRSEVAVMKSPNRDETIWVVMHICMEITQRISLYSYLHLKLEKNSMFSLLSFMSFLQQNQGTRG